jgi:hypothetical protein
MKYRILNNRVKLIDSYLVSKARYETELNVVRYLNPTCPLWKRSVGSMCREWATHNLLYALRIKRSKTADCDLEFEQTWYHKLAYGVVGTIALWVIK